MNPKSEIRVMKVRKTLAACLSIVITVAFMPLPAAQATTFANRGARPAAERMVQPVKGKIRKAMHNMVEKMKGHRKHVRHKGARVAMSHGGCKGTYMYPKRGKCMDARNK
jgi:hypothetical protein